MLALPDQVSKALSGMEGPPMDLGITIDHIHFKHEDATIEGKETKFPGSEMSPDVTQTTRTLFTNFSGITTTATTHGPSTPRFV